MYQLQYKKLNTCNFVWQQCSNIEKFHTIYICRVHSQPGNQGIVREFENEHFFTEKSGNYQGILIEYQGNQGKISLKNIFQL